MAKTSKSYNLLRQELDDIVTGLQREDLDVEKALELYEKGQTTIKELEDYLAKAENQVKELKAKFAK